MLVSDVIKSAMRFLGMDKFADALSSDTQDEELTRCANAMLHCYNAVEDELSRGYFPLSAEETLNVYGGKLLYTNFTRTPVKILSVTAEGREVKYSLEPTYMAVNAPSVTVKYTYFPAKKTLSSASEYSGVPVGERLMAYGVASEYSLILGDIDGAECWESRYVQEIERCLPNGKRAGFIPARCWV